MSPRIRLVVALLALAPAVARGQSGGEVAGTVAVLEKGGKRARDVADAVVWLEGAGSPKPVAADVVTEGKQFRPGVIVVGAGSSVSFPNHDPFNHNVFSLADVAPFDLGLYGRGETRVARFPKAGVVPVYCNVHAQMGAVIVVVDSPWFAQPAADGSFRIAGVPPGRYQLRVWHERGGEQRREVEVGPGGLADLSLSLDASGFKPKPHLNKFGKPYENQGRRY